MMIHDTSFRKCRGGMKWKYKTFEDKQGGIPFHVFCSAQIKQSNMEKTFGRGAIAVGDGSVGFGFGAFETFLNVRDPMWWQIELEVDELFLANWHHTVTGYGLVKRGAVPQKLRIRGELRRILVFMV